MVITLKNETLALEFDKEKGTLIGVASALTGWKPLDKPELGLSYRLMVPMPGRRDNPVYGEKQRQCSVDITPDGRSAVFKWDRVRSEHGGELAIEVVMTVEMTGRQAVFTLEIANNSGYTVENAYCPYIGDVRRPEGAESFKALVWRYASAEEWPIWPSYQNKIGYYGVDCPIQYGECGGSHGSPVSPFVLLMGAAQGLYAGVREKSSEPVAWNTELRPGYADSIGHSVAEDAAVRFAAVHVPYVLPGEKRKLTPVALEAFTGGWQQGADIYKSWRGSWMKTAAGPAWAREPHAWRQIHINSPEDELRVKYKDLPQLGEECAKHGIKAMQLVGWNKGGQDRGNPSHDVDPRLGTFEELKEAIAKIQSYGVKLILFAKFTWADRADEWFRNGLDRLAAKDPHGDHYMHGGYRYQTATQLLDINTRRLVPMCFSSEEYLELCDREFQKMVNLGADGILFDECMHHGNALLCFDMSHGHRYGAPAYENDIRLINGFAGTLPDGKEFLFSGEACYDWLFEAYHLSYHRSDNKDHIPLSRYLLPEARLMSAVTGFDDRNMVNQCLMYRYIMSYEPYNFKGKLADFPATLEYGKKMDALRTELREYFWDGEFRHELGAAVARADGTPHRPYGVFIHKDGRKKGMVICNYDEAKEATVRASVDGGSGPMRYRLVDADEWKTASDGITIPPLSAAVVVE